MKKIIVLMIMVISISSLFASAIIVQDHYRWRNDDGDEVNATWIADEDTGITINSDANIRIRFDLSNRSAEQEAGLNTANLQYSLDEINWVDITTDGSSNHFVLSLSNYFDDGDPAPSDFLTNETTNQASGEMYETTSNFSGTFPVVTGFEYEWCIKPTATIQNADYYFRVDGIVTGGSFSNTFSSSRSATLTYGAALTTYEIGSGTYEFDYPLHTYDMDSRLQTIYYSSEFPGGMQIYSILLDVSQLPGSNLENLHIRMKETVDTSLSLFDNTGLIEVAHLTNVSIPATGWWEIPLDIPFYYSGILNLLIDFCIDNSALGSSGATLADEYPGTNRSCAMWSWLANGNLLNYGSNVDVYDYANNIQFEGFPWNPDLGNLEGNVAQYGTGSAIPDATIEIISSGLTTTSDANGDYVFYNMIPGFYDLTCSVEGYIDATATNVEIIADDTTILNFDMTWAEIVVDPTEITATLNPNETLEGTFNISNTTAGNGELEYFISFSVDEQREITYIADENAKKADIISVGNSVPLDKIGDYFTTEPELFDTEISVDKNGKYNTKTEPNEPITIFRNEEVFGNDDHEFYEDFEHRGNIFHCTSATVLEEHRFYMNIPEPVEMWFCVYEGDVQVGIYDLVSISNIPESGTGLGWYSSGTVNVPLYPEKYYMILTIFRDYAYYYYEYYVTPYPYPASFGELIAAAGWSWDPDAYFPPPATHDVPAYAFGDPIDVALYQTLVTSNAWFVIDDLASGTVLPGDNIDIPYTFDSTNLGGETKTGHLTIYNNVGDDLITPITLTITGTALLPPENVEIDNTTGLLTWEEPAGEVNGYNIYLDDEFVELVTENQYQFENLEPGATYTAGVTAVYDGGESIIVEVEFTFYPPINYPPENVAIDDQSGLLTWDAPSDYLFMDNFDYYTAGDYLCTQSDNWTTWTNNPGGNNDAFVSDDQAHSGANSVLIDQGSESDIIHLFGNLTTGAYDVSIWFYVEPGFGGYYNLLQEFTEFGSRTEWGIEVFFDADESGFINAGGANSAAFTYPAGTWFKCTTLVDLDNDHAELYVDGQFVHEWQWSIPATGGEPGINALGAIDIFANAPTGDTYKYYFDDFSYFVVNTRELLGYNIYLDDMTTPIAENIPDLEYQLTSLIYNQQYTAGVSAIYDEGESEIIEIYFTYIGTSAENDVVAATKLNNNYPNPFNPTTTISFSLKETGYVTIDIYNIRGQLVKTLVNGEFDDAHHEVVWDGKDNSGKNTGSGVYFYKMKAGKFAQTKKMILMK